MEEIKNIQDLFTPEEIENYNKVIRPYFELAAKHGINIALEGFTPLISHLCNIAQAQVLERISNGSQDITEATRQAHENIGITGHLVTDFENFYQLRNE